MDPATIDKAWRFLDAVYHDFGDDASTTIRSLSPDDQNDVLWMYASLLKGCMVGTERRRELASGEGLKMLRSQFTHPSDGPRAVD